MTATRPPTPPREQAASTGPDDWLASVAERAGRASGAPTELLGEYLPMLADAAIRGQRPAPADLIAVRELGRLAAEQGVDAARAVELYLSAAWRLWRELPMLVRSRDREKVRAAAEAVLRVLDDAVAALVDGHQSARRDMVRYEEALRREFIDDLLRGDADVASMVERAEPFGLDLSKPHHVALATSRSQSAQIDRAAIVLERAIVDQFGDRDVLVATKDGRVIVLVPSTTPNHTKDVTDVSRVVHAALDAMRGNDRWQVATGRAFPGMYGIARSYEEARESIIYAERLDLDVDIVDPRDLLVYRVLGRDQAAIIDLVRDVLGPLDRVRGGPALLIDSLWAYFGAGNVATEAAARLNVSVRTVTYRLAKVSDLTGYSPSIPDQRFALHAAVLGARLLQWPHQPLPDA
ncbi:MAG: helix-turn-helix domain-containing protein [Jatrophihabitantaceae bacterium]